MKTYEVSEQFIIDAHSYANEENAERIAKQFPELFKEAVIGKWYNVNGRLINFKKYGNGGNYGINGFGHWNEDMGFHGGDEKTPATPSEIESHLIKEAEKRGFKDGVKVKRPSEWGHVFQVVPINESGFTYSSYEDSLTTTNGREIYRKGKWATIIEEAKEVTIEEVAKKFGVSTIKIVDK